MGCGWARSGPSVAPRSPDARVGIDAPTKLLHRAHRSPRRLCARALQTDICVDGQRCGFRRRGRAGVRGGWCAPQTCALKGDSEGISRAKPKPEGKGGATTTSRPSPVISCTPSASSCVRRTPSTPSSRSSRLAAPSFALRLPRDMRVNVSRLGSCRRDAAGCQRPTRLRRGRGPRTQSDHVRQQHEKERARATERFWIVGTNHDCRHIQSRLRAPLLSALSSAEARSAASSPVSMAPCTHGLTP